MNCSSTHVLLLALICCVSQATQILRLSPDSFAHTIEKHKLVLVIFHAVWCPQSQEIANTLQKMMRDERFVADITSMNVKIAVVEGADKDESLRHQLGIEEYPHISLFIEGSQVKFDGIDNSEEELLNFIKRKHNNFSKEIFSFNEIEAVIQTQHHMVLFTGKKTHPRFKPFIEASHKFDQEKFAFTTSQEIMDQLDLERNEVYILFTGGRVLKFDKAWKEDSISRWVYVNTSPKLKELDEELLDFLQATKSPALVLLLPHSENKDDEKSTNEELLKFLEDNASLFINTYYGVICHQENSHCHALFDAAQYEASHPALIAVKHHKDHVTPLIFEYPDEDLLKNPLKKWLELIDQGSAPLYSFNDPRGDIPIGDSSTVAFTNFFSLSGIIGGDRDLVLIIVDNKTESMELWRTAQDNFVRIQGALSQQSSNSIIFRAFNADRNSHFALQIKSSKVPFVRFYQKHQISNYHETRLAELDTLEKIVNLILDLASGDMPELNNMFDNDI